MAGRARAGSFSAGSFIFVVTPGSFRPGKKTPLRDDVEQVRVNDSFAFRLSSAGARRPRRSWHRPSRTVRDRLPWDHRACPSPTLDKMEDLCSDFRVRPPPPNDDAGKLPCG